ncbi:hypothetical protein B0H13DRAFT_1011076 [Mycena leptocephala]|nr:hypothetical protein B0H13DRAFT_1011076 [Mycena leptocephala]
MERSRPLRRRTPFKTGGGGMSPRTEAYRFSISLTYFPPSLGRLRLGGIQRNVDFVALLRLQCRLLYYCDPSHFKIISGFGMRPPGCLVLHAHFFLSYIMSARLLSRGRGVCTGAVHVGPVMPHLAKDCTTPRKAEWGGLGNGAGHLLARRPVISVPLVPSCRAAPLSSPILPSRTNPAPIAAACSITVQRRPLTPRRSRCHVVLGSAPTPSTTLPQRRLPRHRPPARPLPHDHICLLSYSRVPRPHITPSA